MISLIHFTNFTFNFSVEVIVRAEAVERAQAGDKCDFTGSLIVVPDVASLSMPGARAETSSRNRGPEGGPQGEGVSGLKALGVRDLAYRLAFLACHVKACNRKVSVKSRRTVVVRICWGMPKYIYCTRTSMYLIKIHANN